MDVMALQKSNQKEHKLIFSKWKNGEEKKNFNFICHPHTYRCKVLTKYKCILYDQKKNFENQKTEKFNIENIEFQSSSCM